MRLFFIALQFLTIIPLPFQLRWEEHDLGRSMAWFPLAGLTLGALLAGLQWCLAQVLPAPMVALLLVTALALVTGALHLDGLADVCDGLAARGGRERFLTVMKDSRVGAVGVVGLVLGLLLKYQALAQLSPAELGRVLFLFPAVARFSQVQLAVGARRARADGLGAACIAGAGMREFAIAAVTMLAAAWLLLALQGVACVVVAWLFTWLAKGWFHRRLGGVTGDVIGCVSELNEIICLLVLVAFSAGSGG
ncbi:MAG TPA: adenosylcobinamide-GDP ribazoletransferase [Geobacteraceae bacterium]